MGDSGFDNTFVQTCPGTESFYQVCSHFNCIWMYLGWNLMNQSCILCNNGCISNILLLLHGNTILYGRTNVAIGILKVRQKSCNYIWNNKRNLLLAVFMKLLENSIDFIVTQTTALNWFCLLHIRTIKFTRTENTIITNVEWTFR